MTWSWTLDGWIVAAGALAAMSCALLGNFLLLRRMSMMGDAISHAVLPGLAAAFLITNSRATLPMFIGAAAVGVLTALLTQWIHSLGKVEQSASMGVVFTLLFAVGLIMIVQAADDVDLDPSCVLIGDLENIPMQTLAGAAVPPTIVRLLIVLAVDLAFVVLFYKELKISSFDPGLATTQGINANLMHYLLMTLVAVTTVAAFESVGSILVIAMLIVPGAAAHLLTDRLPRMIAISLVIALASAVAGHYTAVVGPGWFGYEGVSTLTSGMMAVAAGAIFLVVMLAAPRHGVLSKLFHRAALALRIIKEDVLGLLYRLEELRHEHAESRSLIRRAVGVGPITSRLALWSLARDGRLVTEDGRYRLTPAGRESARDVVRSHRLWEAYLAKHLGLPLDHLHEPASRLEHHTDPHMREELDAAMEKPAVDPHGRGVPSERG